jgi:ABC-type multidrug transport system permease subunit
LTGKLLSGATVLALISLVALTLARWGLGIGFHNLPGTLAFAVLFGVFMELFFMVLQTLASNSRSGNLLANAVLFPLVMVGGAFFPFEAMPEWMARIGKLTPNGWSLVMEKSIMAGTVEIPHLLATLVGLVVLGGVFYLLSLRRLMAFARS